MDAVMSQTAAGARYPRLASVAAVLAVWLGLALRPSSVGGR